MGHGGETNIFRQQILGTWNCVTQYLSINLPTTWSHILHFAGLKTIPWLLSSKYNIIQWLTKLYQKIYTTIIIKVKIPVSLFLYKTKLHKQHMIWHFWRPHGRVMELRGQSNQLLVLGLDPKNFYLCSIQKIKSLLFGGVSFAYLKFFIYLCQYWTRNKWVNRQICLDNNQCPNYYIL